MENLSDSSDDENLSDSSEEENRINSSELTIIIDDIAFESL